ncbi:putative secreted protein [Corynebacterium diphtheriae]|nr:putative secreted protein [Corynebacterium diphtheriae]
MRADGNMLGVCTVGFVDTENNRVWTDAHCGENGAAVMDNFQNPIGILHHVYPSEWERLHNIQGTEWSVNSRASDVAYVEIDDPTVLGQNYFSQNTIARDPAVGDNLCNYGGRTDLVACTPITNINGPVVITADNGSEHGDSSGPAWIEGKGYVGQLLGSDVGDFTTTVFRKIADQEINSPIDLSRSLPFYDFDVQKLRNSPVTTPASAADIMRAKAVRDREERETMQRYWSGEELTPMREQAREDRANLDAREAEIEGQVSREADPEKKQELERDLENTRATKEVVEEYEVVIDCAEGMTEDEENAFREFFHGLPSSWLQEFLGAFRR